MERIGFVMRLRPGCGQEYRRRHAAIWPELAALLRQTGIREYSIFLEENTLQLFAILSIDDPAGLSGLAQHPVMRRWWEYMEDMMETNPDHSPVAIPLKEVFYLA